MTHQPCYTNNKKERDMTEQTQEVDVNLELQKAQLKVQALNEAVTRAGYKRSEETAQLENTIADLRVDLTLVTNERDALKARVEEFENQAQDQKSPANDKD